jgi:hypothetical protein
MLQRAVAGVLVITVPWTAIMSLISERRELGAMVLPLLCFIETSMASWAMLGCLRRRR